MTTAALLEADPQELQARCLRWRAEGLRVGLVPTMGALHEGHLSLVRAARAASDRVIVSIFVNPLQFGPGEDLARYPRDLGRDAELLAPLGVGVVFAPTPETLYPPGHQTRVHVTELTGPLCGASRPGHFEGVTTVVSILLALTLPHAAWFGRKDYQQFRVLERLARDLRLPTAIIGMPIVREADGLALSSRNAYLSAAQRARALAIPRGLAAAAEAVAAGEREAAAVVAAARAPIEASVDRLDYLELRDAQTLRPVERLTRPAVLAVAAYLGATRLIDNAELSPPPVP